MYKKLKRLFFILKTFLSELNAQPSDLLCKNVFVNRLQKILYILCSHPSTIIFYFRSKIGIRILTMASN